ncbi:BURP domain-containing protein BNM2A [Malania oleifera]|uniref:BURP domain-containing protein BNM2A n=1 Tax=Malania oleifera TaxID=397392 RepID=UPI0025AE104D|nr:BURP domain-containing protein BNM2A [Malania oleifera]XP_057977470.1 BURP domain-containing protein BNM2A [Malania oleifera]XP_057977471.1 BURP domain-containing protein BNM2A [Malania oleifera]XP_057977472.1 BURP domain-containing protein BNM2A [Malania oleifera]
MDFRFASWSIILFGVFLTGDHQIYGEQHDNNHQIPYTQHVHAHPSSRMDHMDPSQNIFFTIGDLKVGKMIPIYLPSKDPSTSPHLLPREEADSIPFSSSHLPNLLEFFSFPRGSPQAKAMEYTLRLCELEPIKGETRFCATSLESMLDFTQGIFGLDTQFKVLTSKHLSKSTAGLQNYTILELPKQLSAPKMVACHTMPYPYAVFYCHCQESKNKLFEVLVGGENGERAEAIAVCHMDTSHWDRDHTSFRMLGIQPGTSPVCHFFPTDNLVWIPSHASN